MFWTHLRSDAIGLMWVGTGLLVGAWLGPAIAALLGAVMVVVAAIALTITQLRSIRRRR